MRAGILAGILVVVAAAISAGAPAAAPAAGAATAASPAIAATAGRQGVEVSHDGLGFAAALEQPLFRVPPIVVPGGVVSSRVWVRNASDRPAVLRFSGTGAWSTSAVFAEQLLVSAGATGEHDRIGIPLGRSADCALLYTGPVLPPGGVVALEVSLAFAADTAGRDAQGARAGIDFVAALRDPDEPAGESADCAGAPIPGLPAGDGGGAPPASGGPGSVASTGTAALALAGTCAAALLVGSSLLGFAAYRRRGIRGARRFRSAA